MNLFRDIVGKFSYWSALVLMFSLFAPMYFTRIAIVVWASFWILEFRWLDKKNIVLDKTLLCLLGILLVYLIELLSLFWTISPNETWGMLSRQVYFLAVVPVMLFGVNDYYKPKNMLYALMFGAVFFSAIYYTSLFCSASYNIMYGNEITEWQKIPLWKYGDRFHVFKHHSYFGLKMLIAAIGACFIRKNVEKVEGKWASYFLIILFCVASFFSTYVSGTRSTMIAIPVVVFVALGWYFRKKVWVVALFGTIFMGAFSYWVLNYHTHSQHSTEVLIKSVEKGSDPRVKIWKASADIAPDYFFFGSGAGTGRIRLTKYYAQNNYPISFINRRLGAHNQYIAVLLDVGMFALAIYVLSLFLIYFYHDNQRTKLFALLVSIAYAVHLVFENMTDGTEGIVTLCVLLMLINWMHRCDKRGIEW